LDCIGVTTKIETLVNQRKKVYCCVMGEKRGNFTPFLYSSKEKDWVSDQDALERR